jgi:hypothetical protein
MKVQIEKDTYYCVACMSNKNIDHVRIIFNNHNGQGLYLCKDCQKQLALALINNCKESITIDELFKSLTNSSENKEN